VIPRDLYGTVGNGRIIAIGNVSIECPNKGGHLMWRDALSDFFAPLTPLTRTFNPKIIYDQYDDRLVAGPLERVGADPPALIIPDNISRILVAVSKDGNPRTPFDKRSHTPILVGVSLDQPSQKIPWLRNLQVDFQYL
jgi:hypothetical protein